MKFNIEQNSNLCFKIFTDDKHENVGEIEVSKNVTQDTIVMSKFLDADFILEKDYHAKSEKTKSYTVMLGDYKGKIITGVNRISPFVTIPAVILRIDDTEYKAYNIQLGQKGIKIPMFRGITQIALIELPSVLSLGSITGNIICDNEESALFAIMCFSYIFITDYQKTLEKARKNTLRILFKSRSKHLLEQYDEMWKSKNE